MLKLLWITCLLAVFIIIISTLSDPIRECVMPVVINLSESQPVSVIKLRKVCCWWFIVTAAINYHLPILTFGSRNRLHCWLSHHAFVVVIEDLLEVVTLSWSFNESTMIWKINWFAVRSYFNFGVLVWYRATRFNDSKLTLLCARICWVLLIKLQVWNIWCSQWLFRNTKPRLSYRLELLLLPTHGFL